MNMPLNRQPNIADPDGFYEELIDSQRDLDDEAAALMNSKLVLILANHVGDAACSARQSRWQCRRRRPRRLSGLGKGARGVRQG